MMKKIVIFILSLFKMMLELQDVTDMIVQFFTADNVNMFLGKGGAIHQLGTLPSLITAIAYTVLAIGFVLGLYSMAVQSDTVQAHGLFIPLKFFFKIMVIKIVVDTIQPIFLTLVTGFAEFAKRNIGGAGKGNYQTQELIARFYENGEFKDSVVKGMNKELGFSAVLLLGLFLVGVAFMLVISVMIGFYLLGVMLDCLLYYFAAPIAVASLSCKEWSDVGRRYLQTIFSIGLNILLIAVAVRLGSWIFQNIFTINDLSGNGLGKAFFANTVMSPSQYVDIITSDNIGKTIAEKNLGSLFVVSFKVIVGTLILGAIMLTFIKKARQVANSVTGGTF